MTTTNLPAVAEQAVNPHIAATQQGAALLLRQAIVQLADLAETNATDTLGQAHAYAIVKQLAADLHALADDIAARITPTIPRGQILAVANVGTFETKPKSLGTQWDQDAMWGHLHQWVNTQAANQDGELDDTAAQAGHTALEKARQMMSPPAWRKTEAKADGLPLDEIAPTRYEPGTRNLIFRPVDGAR